jgi:transcriptional regulator with XRE-family HTH domain
MAWVSVDGKEGRAQNAPMTAKVNILTDDTSPDDSAQAVHAAMATRIASLRKARELSFDQFAARCGVSKGMLVQIEQGKANPSIGTLCRIASGLGVSVAELLEVAESGHLPVRVVSADEVTTLWTGPRGGTARLLIGSEGPDMLEHWMWELRPGERFDAQAHPHGTQELFHVLEGELVLELNGTGYRIGAGSSAHARTDCEHAYVCGGKKKLRFTMVVLEPGRERRFVAKRSRK